MTKRRHESNQELMTQARKSFDLGEIAADEGKYGTAEKYYREAYGTICGLDCRSRSEMELLDNAQWNLGEVQYHQGKAIDAFSNLDAVMKRSPGGVKGNYLELYKEVQERKTLEEKSKKNAKQVADFVNNLKERDTIFGTLGKLLDNDIKAMESVRALTKECANILKEKNKGDAHACDDDIGTSALGLIYYVSEYLRLKGLRFVGDVLYRTLLEGNGTVMGRS